MSVRRLPPILVLLVVLLAGVALAPAARAGTATERIVGGTAVSDIRTRPFQVLLWNPGTSLPAPASGFFCGGTVVDARHVVTAAHCVTEDDAAESVTPASRIAVMAGSVAKRRSGGAIPAGSKEVRVSVVARNPAYDPKETNGDAAVLTLATPLWTTATAPALDGTTTIAPLARAASGSSLASGADVGISGWGSSTAQTDDYTGAQTYPATLRAAVTHVVSPAACGAVYSGITSAMLCAGETTGGIDTCYGDSGGPLVSGTGAARVLEGIVSFGWGCAQPGLPGVYGRVADAQMHAFIESAIAAPVPATGGGASGGGTATTPAAASAPSTTTGSGTAAAASSGSTTAPAASAGTASTTAGTTSAAASDEGPTVGLSSRTCRGSRCVVNVAALASRGNTVKRVRGVLRSTRKKACRRKGRASRCTVTARRAVAFRHLGGDHWAATVRGMTRRTTYRLRTTATDRAGNATDAPITVRLRRR